MKINQLFDKESYTYTYLINDPKNTAVIIDPVLDQFERDSTLIETLDLKLEFIIETHVHADHITSAFLMKEKFQSKIAYGKENEVIGADLFLEHDQILNIGSLELKILHTPGHTAGCISIYSDGFIFCGDTLFIKGAGRTDFQGGSSQSSFDSIKNKLFALPGDTVVYPAHDYKGMTSSSIYQEKIWNESINERTTKDAYVKRDSEKSRPYPKKFDIAVPANTHCGDASKIRK
ncbi:MBL fold metallo-hydrolase [bacterium]|jgi:sulfur dioxygenase|nr:MBL fold metallo-hydrolase [bacterium]